MIKAPCQISIKDLATFILFQQVYLHQILINPVLNNLVHNDQTHNQTLIKDLTTLCYVTDIFIRLFQTDFPYKHLLKTLDKKVILFSRTSHKVKPLIA